MQDRPGRARYRVPRLHLIAAVLAIAAQIFVVLAPVAEGRAGVGMGAHVESRGSPSHHVHEESQCVACQVRTMHGVAGSPPVAAPAGPVRTTVATSLAQGAPSADRVASSFPRAPPCVI